MSWKGKTVLVLGLGESGLAMALWLHRQGARVRVADSRSEPPFAAELQRSAPGAALLAGPFNEALIDGVGLVGLSPGLSRTEPAVAEAAPRALGAGERLRRLFGADDAAWALGQAALRRKAAAKFERADEMLFTRAGLEQATRRARARCLDRQSPPW